MAYQIWGKYGGLAPEVIDEADSQEEANDLLAEYKMAFGRQWELWVSPEVELRDNPYCQCRRNPRSMERFGPPGRPETPRCLVCGAPTREGKLYCSDHIDQSPYVTDLEQRLGRMEEEDLLAEREDLLPQELEGLSQSQNLKELLLELHLKGPRTIERLTRELNKSAKAIENYVKILERRGIVERKTNKRGSEVISLVKK